MLTRLLSRVQIRMVLVSGAALAAILLLSFFTAPALAAPMISHIVITNVRDVQFTVTWRTDVAATGTVHYGTTVALGSTANDDRGPATSSNTHHVTVAGLAPNTTYFFDNLSGATTDNNGGSHYSVTTGPTLSLPASDLVYGQVYKSDGTTLAEGAIVYLYLGDGNSAGSTGNSSTMSSLVDASGYWFFNLGGTRTSNHASAFTYSSGDTLSYYGVDGQGKTSAVSSVDTASSNPKSDLVLSVPTAAELLSFNAEAANGNEVAIRWQTGTELNLQGFFVWKSVQSSGDYVQLDPEMVQAKRPGTLTGNEYQQIDTNILVGEEYAYKLESVLADGTSSWTEPVLVTMPAACATAPTKPALIAPKAKKQVKKRSPNLKWEPVACATEYQVTIRLGTKQGEIVKQFESLTEPTVRTGRFANGETYVWRVKACNRDLCANSKWRKFTVNKPPKAK